MRVRSDTFQTCNRYIVFPLKVSIRSFQCYLTFWFSGFRITSFILLAGFHLYFTYALLDAFSHLYISGSVHIKKRIRRAGMIVNISLHLLPFFFLSESFHLVHILSHLSTHLSSISLNPCNRTRTYWPVGQVSQTFRKTLNETKALNQNKIFSDHEVRK